MVAITTAPSPRRPAGNLRLVAPPVRDGVSWARLLAVAVAVLVVAAAGTYLVRAEPAAAPGTAPVLDTTHTVAEGETMWSIANEVAPAGEAATYVERLVAANGGAAVTPGQVLTLPVP